MTEMPSYMIENPKFGSYKPKKRCYYSSSIFSIVLSIFIYIMIFYVFEVSPSSIFSNTKVLFFISNTLILIIAADYGAFTHKESHDYYNEYTATTATMRSRVNNYSTIPVLGQGENHRETEIKNLKDVQIKEPKEEEEEANVKEIVCVTHPGKTIRVVSEEKQRDGVAIEDYKPVTSEEAYKPVTSEEANKPVRSEEANKPVRSEEACNARKDVNPKPYGRSKSDRPRRVRRISDERETKRKSYGRRKSESSKWMVVPEKWENVEEESEEFSKMSNEELNRRVEDFIQRFNREIRLQSRVSSPT